MGSETISGLFAPLLCLPAFQSKNYFIFPVFRSKIRFFRVSNQKTFVPYMFFLYACTSENFSAQVSEKYQGANHPPANDKWWRGGVGCLLILWKITFRKILLKIRKKFFIFDCKSRKFLNFLIGISEKFRLLAEN